MTMYTPNVSSIRVTRDVGLTGSYTGWLNVSADLEWWREVLVRLPENFPGAEHIAEARLAILREGESA